MCDSNEQYELLELRDVDDGIATLVSLQVCTLSELFACAGGCCGGGVRSCGISMSPPQKALTSIEFLFIARYCSARFRLTRRCREEHAAGFPAKVFVGIWISKVRRVLSSRPKLRVARCACGLFDARFPCERATAFTFTRRCGIFVERHRWTCAIRNRLTKNTVYLYCTHQFR